MTFYQRRFHFWESIAWVKSCITFVKDFTTKQNLYTELVYQLIIPVILYNEKSFIPSYFPFISGFVRKGWLL